MDKNEITRLAREAGFVGMDGDHGALRRFAHLVAAAERERIIAANAPEIEAVNTHIKALEDAIAVEREACAKLCEAQSARWHSDQRDVYVTHECAAAIRARGNQ